jgi:hypothetical protein
MMMRMCRNLPARASRRGASTLLCHARIVTDPKKLARLYAEADKQKRCATPEQTITGQKHIL